ncbi:MAG: hypothetical protein KF891_22775 [Rhizobacter sp.]|nr:hypothetical protein [Rhizobacter sp.]
MSELPPGGAPEAQKAKTEAKDTAQAPAPEATPAAPRSAFTLLVADRNGRTLPLDPGPDGVADPTDAKACELVFDVAIEAGTSPDTTDLALLRQLKKIGHALRELYLDSQPPREDRFRPYFVRLFYIAQLALEGDVSLDAQKKKKVGDRLSTEAARAEVAALEKDLIEDEAPRLKNSRLARLAGAALNLSVIFLTGYVLLMLLPGSGDVVKLLGALGVERNVLAYFMLLWVGCFVGVCLSYAIRTHDFGIAELTCDNPDFLAPHVRLLLTGTFAAVLAMVAIAGLGDVELGSLKLSDVKTDPTKAFLLGAILGLGEQKLMGTVQARLGGFFGGTAEAKATAP